MMNRNHEYHVLQPKIFLTTYSSFGIAENTRDQLVGTYNEWEKKGAITVVYLFNRSDTVAQLYGFCPVFESTDSLKNFSDEEIKSWEIKKDYITIGYIGDSHEAKIRACEEEFHLKMGMRINLVVELTEVSDMIQTNEMNRKLEELRFTINSRHRHIQYMRGRFGDDPEMRESILREVRVIEYLQHEADALSGFNELQMEAHSIVIKTDTEDSARGSMSASEMARLLRSFCVQVLDKAAKDFNPMVRVRGLVYGSAAIIADIETDEAHPEKIIQTNQDLKEVLSKVSTLIENGDPEKRARRFQKEIGDKRKASDIADAVNDLIPSAAQGHEYIKIRLPSIDYEVTFTPELRETFVAARKILNETKNFEPLEEKVFRGELGSLTAFTGEVVHKISVLDADGNKHEIRYERNVKIDREVKNSVQTQVAVRARFEKQKWVFIKWEKS